MTHDMDESFAICLNSTEYPASLECHKLYAIIPDEEAALEGDLRIIDESGEDYLYPASYFLVVTFPRETTHVLQESFAHSLQMAYASPTEGKKIGG